MARTKGAVDRKPRKPYTRTKPWAGGRPSVLASWPGPFVPRTDCPKLVRPAVWVNCAYCHKLFVRGLFLIRKDKSEKLYCTIACGGLAKKAFPTRNCRLCGRIFMPGASKHKKYCSPLCVHRAQSLNMIVSKNKATNIYLTAHGLSSKDQLACEVCGKTQVYKGKTAYAYVRVNHKDKNRKNISPSNLRSICGYCYDRGYK